MIRLTILPRENQPYGEYQRNEEALFFVEWPDGRQTDLVITIRAFLANWSPSGIARIEGYTTLPTGVYRVIGYCQLHSTNAHLGTFEIQGA